MERQAEGKNSWRGRQQKQKDGQRQAAGTDSLGEQIREAYKMHVAKKESKQFLRRLLLQKGLCGIYDMYDM